VDALLEAAWREIAAVRAAPPPPPDREEDEAEDLISPARLRRDA
jgi:hypothetical protein